MTKNNLKHILLRQNLLIYVCDFENEMDLEALWRRRWVDAVCIKFLQSV